MSSPPAEPRDPAVVFAAVLGLFAAGLLLTFVDLTAAALPATVGRVPGVAASSSRRLAPATSAQPARTGAARTVTARPRTPDPTGTVTATATAALTATAVLRSAVTAGATVSATLATSATLAAGSATSEAVHAVSPPAPFFRFRRPFDPQAHAVEPSRYYPYGTTGRGEYLLHHGVDMGNPLGAEVLAVGDGEVVYAGDDRTRLWGPQSDFYGNVVVIRHPETLEDQPLYSLYGHLSEVKAQPGQSVKAGEVIGLVGMEGIALGPHLHLEFRVGEPGYEATRNAELFLAPLAGRGTIIGRLRRTDGSPLPSIPVALFHNTPDDKSYVSETASYPNRHVNATAEFGENFLFADIPAGTYTVSAPRAGVKPVPVTVTDGGVVTVDLRP